MVSGSAGLHLNMINVLNRMHSADDAMLSYNITEDCARSVAAAAHVTATLYVKSEHFKENSVMCWNAARTECSDECAAFAAELNCVQASCADVPMNVLQQ